MSKITTKSTKAELLRRVEELEGQLKKLEYTAANFAEEAKVRQFDATFRPYFGDSAQGDMFVWTIIRDLAREPDKWYAESKMAREEAHARWEALRVR